MSLFEAMQKATHDFVLADDAPIKVTHIPTVAREVFNITGAGDTVVAAFTLAKAYRNRKLEEENLGEWLRNLVR